MSSHSDPINLLFTLTTEALATHCVYPNASHQRLILPRESQYAKITLNFFSSKRQKLKMFAQKIIHNKPLYCIENDYMKSRKAAAGYPNACPAVSLGTPGPYNKQSVLLIDNNLRPVSLTKVGSNEETSRLLQNETSKKTDETLFGDKRQ